MMNRARAYLVSSGMLGRYRVVDHIVGHLAAIGVDHVFGVDGANIEDVLRRRALPRRRGGAGQARVLRGHHGRRVQPKRGRPGRGSRDLGWGSAEPRRGSGRVAGEPGSGAGVGRPARHHDGWSGQLPGHQWRKRIAERRGAVLGGIGVLRAAAQAGRHRRATSSGHRRGAHRRPSGSAAAQGLSAGMH